MEDPLRVQMAFLLANVDRLAAEYPGKHLSIRGETVHGAFETFEQGVQAGVRQFPFRSFSRALHSGAAGSSTREHPGAFVGSPARCPSSTSGLRLAAGRFPALQLGIAPRRSRARPDPGFRCSWRRARQAREGHCGQRRFQPRSAATPWLIPAPRLLALTGRQPSGLDSRQWTVDSSPTHEGEAIPIFACKIEFSGLGMNLQAHRARGANLSSQNLFGLIGRDVRANCVLVYNGPDGSFSLSL